jgi:hypothetical protein
MRRKFLEEAPKAVISKIDEEGEPQKGRCNPRICVG